MSEKNEPATLGDGAAGPTENTRDRQHNQTLRQLRCRRAASSRVVPLDCGCPDPWPCRCTQPPLSDRTIEGGRAAAFHLLMAGVIPVLDIEIRRALWRRGGTDRVLAELLHDACGGEVA